MRSAKPLTLLLALVLAGCSTADSRPATDSLYRELGEAQGIDRLVEKLLDNVYADERIGYLFADVDRANLHRLISEQFCQEAGGPCAYTGLAMSESHSGLGITHMDFDAFVGDFTDAMEQIGLPYRTQNRMLKIFAPMRSDITDK